MRGWGTILLMLSACAPMSVLTDGQRGAGDATARAWAEAGLPAPNKRRCNDMTRFYVTEVTVDEFPLHCHALATKTAGCLSWKSSNHFFRPYEWPEVVTWAKYRDDMGLVVHELLHAYIRCAAIGNGVWDPGDRSHANPAVWEAAGGEKSVQWRANQLMLED